MCSENNSRDVLVLTALPDYIGTRYAMLVRQLGYKTLGDLADVREVNLSSLGGFGTARLDGLRRALADHGLAFQPTVKVDLTNRIAATKAIWERDYGLTDGGRQ